MDYTVVYLGDSPLEVYEACEVITVNDPLRLIDEIGKVDLTIINSDMAIEETDVQLINEAIEKNNVPLLLYLDDHNNDVIRHAYNYTGILRSSDSKEIVSTLINNIIKNHRRTKTLLYDSDLLELFLKYSINYVFFKDEQARVLKLSNNFNNMIGMPIEQAIGKNMMELFPSQLAKSMVEDDLRILHNGESVEVIEQLKGRYYKTSKFPIKREGKLSLLAGFSIDISDLKETERLLVESKDKIEKLIVTDELLDIYNRRGFLKELKKEINRTKHYGIKSTLIILDVDKFKTVNDSLGHFKADNFLKDLVDKVNNILRESDSFGRLGGDEFAIICESTPIEMGEKIAKRIRKLINEEPVIVDQKPYTYSVSIGLTEINQEHLALEKLLHRADLALYEAKKGGRNCVKSL